jgi:hypothetical protein
VAGLHDWRSELGIRIKNLGKRFPNRRNFLVGQFLKLRALGFGKTSVVEELKELVESPVGQIDDVPDSRNGLDRNRADIEFDR